MRAYIEMNNNGNTNSVDIVLKKMLLVIKSRKIQLILKMKPSICMIKNREISYTAMMLKTMNPLNSNPRDSLKPINGNLLLNWKIKTVSVIRNAISKGALPICGINSPSRSNCLKMGREMSPEYKFLKKCLALTLTKATIKNENDNTTICHSFCAFGNGSGLNEMGSSRLVVKKTDWAS